MRPQTFVCLIVVLLYQFLRRAMKSSPLKLFTRAETTLLSEGVVGNICFLISKVDGNVHKLPLFLVYFALVENGSLVSKAKGDARYVTPPPPLFKPQPLCIIDYVYQSNELSPNNPLSVDGNRIPANPWNYVRSWCPTEIGSMSTDRSSGVSSRTG